MRVQISSRLVTKIRDAATAAAPNEACGLLFGSPSLIDRIVATRNVAETPLRRFEIDPAALIAAHRADREGPPRLIGYWHSHPGGNAVPSATDAAMAMPDGKLWLIVAGADITLWRAVDRGWVEGRFDPVSIVAT